MVCQGRRGSGGRRPSLHDAPSLHMENCTTIQIFFSVLYSLVGLSGLVGNLCVLYVVSFNQVSLSVRSVFIGCLAVSDLLVCLFSLPITAISTFTRVWIFPDFFCQLIGVFQGGSIFVSAFTLSIIAIDRCILVINYGRAMNIVAVIWILGYSFALPVGIFSKADDYPGYCGRFCEEKWPDVDDDQAGSSTLRRAYGLLVMVMQFGVPLLISTICYSLISRVMDSQIRKRRGHSQLLPDSEQRLESRRSRANRMMVCMVLGLVLAYVPINVVNLYRDFFGVDKSEGDYEADEFVDAEEGEDYWYPAIFALCHVTAMTSAVWNPLIYSWFNPQFRTAIRGICRLSRTTSLSTTESLPLKTEATRVDSRTLILNEGRKTTK